MTSLFEPVDLLGQTLSNRVVMAPMTRARAAQPGDLPTAMTARYYGQRAGAGLIVTGLARNEALGRFWLGTTVDSLLARANTPVLVVKERPRAAYGKILVAIDFSETSLRALQTAARLFPDQPLSLLHAFDPPLAGMISEPARYRGEYRKVALADCIAFLAKAGLPADPSGRFDIIVEHGDLETLAWQYVRDRGVDLVVVGKSDPGPLLGLLIGSNSQRVLSVLDCDVLVVPNRPGEE